MFVCYSSPFRMWGQWPELLGTSSTQLIGQLAPVYCTPVIAQHWAGQLSFRMLTKVMYLWYNSSQLSAKQVCKWMLTTPGHKEGLISTTGRNSSFYRAGDWGAEMCHGFPEITSRKNCTSHLPPLKMPMPSFSEVIFERGKPECIWKQVRFREASKLEFVKDVFPRTEGLETKNHKHWVSAPGLLNDVGEKFS